MNLRIKKLAIFRKIAVMGVASAALLTLGGPAQAASFLLNGGFETNSGNGQIGFNTTAADWATSGYNFLYASGTADTSGANGSGGLVKLWGPGDGSANGLPASSPDGGYYVAADSNFEVGAITQTVTGLTVGAAYNLKFYWAAAQQDGFTGATTDQWQVTLGSQTQSTAVLSNPSEGFSGWRSQTFTYTATATSEVLSFLAVGTPSSGAPPFVLLDGVSLTSAPEPGPATMMLGGLLVGIGMLRMKRRSRS